MNATLENTLTPLLLAQLAANPHTAAVLVQDATTAVYVLDHLNRVQLEDPNMIVLLTRDEALGVLEEAAGTIGGALRTAGILL